MVSEGVKPEPTLDREKRLWQQGYRWVAGLDEVGRGAWAGPIFAAAVVLPRERPDLEQVLRDVRDSKVLLPKQRERLVRVICGVAVAVGVGQASHELIDRLGVTAATRLAMASALEGLYPRPDYLLLDAMELPQVAVPQEGIIKGDETCLSIAAASIVAKVVRDLLCSEFEDRYPGYGFGQHKGYGTVEHRRALVSFGCCPIHRMSYKPLLALQDFQEGEDTPDTDE